MNVDLEAALLANAGAKVGVQREANGELTYSGEIALAIGVELIELRYDRGRNGFIMRVPDKALAIRASRDQRWGVLIGDPEAGDVFVAVESH